MGKKGKQSGAPAKETFEPLLIEGKTPGTGVLLLSSTEEEVLLKASEAIYQFAEKGDDNKASLLGLGALEPLCQLVAHDNKLIRRNAVMALGTMACNSDVKNALKKLDMSVIIPSVINRLSGDEQVATHEFATLCLASLSDDYACKIQIFENNGLQPLIKLLSSPDPDVKKNSVEIIFNLVQDSKHRQALHELGGIPPLLELLKADFPVIQHLALNILQIVSTDKDTRNTFREKQGFERIMEVLSNATFSDLYDEALEVAANCLNDSECVQLIHKGGGLKKLMEFVHTPNTPGVQSNAVKCIAMAAQSSENCELLHEQNVENVLLELLSDADVSVKIDACKAVSTTSAYLPSNNRFRELGGIAAVVQCLNDECSELREAATQALLNATRSNQLNALAVYDTGGHTILIQLLSGSSHMTVANSAAILGEMAGQDVVLNSILSNGVIQALMETLDSVDTKVLVNTMQCLAVMASDEDAREEIRNAGGLQPLVNLLHSDDEDVLDNACLVIKACASDKPTTLEICKLGALEILLEITQSLDCRNGYSKSALISLLNFNLPAKYSLTGHLAVADVIQDGFYDAGKACAGQQFLTLEELAKQPVNEKQPIIAVNTAVEEIVSEEKQSNSLARDSGKKEDFKTRKKKKDDKQKDETRPESPVDKPWRMMEDVPLQLLVKEAKESILSLEDDKERYSALARLVSKAMGGAVEMENLHKFQWMLYQSELKFRLQSNVVPIGLIKRGIYRHRALLFKCLADCIGLSCTLVWGEYDRVWNEIFLFNVNPSTEECSSQPRRYIVDLIHQPGRLLRNNTPPAEQYQTTSMNTLV
ncbi:armadillo repeat-containing protein 3 [Antennarius striatus]|uniref:armadillo repeat-containing protein 3 n=1 Tax=Antennarius striatus TaxID=241820 RepID=UPI0035B30BAF